MVGASLLKRPLPPLEAALRDSIAMENCKTFRDLQYVCIGIEARHAVEGISEADLAAYEAVKAQHVKRVAHGLVA